MPAFMLRTRSDAAMAAFLAIALCGGVLAAGLTPAAAPQAKKAEEDKKKEAEKKEAEKKGGGLFGGAKRSTGATDKGDEKRATASAGAKGAAEGSGKAVAARVVSSNDRSHVASMEAAKPTPAEMAAFLKEGKLSPKKGGS